MKKFMFVVLAILMVLPVVVSCSSAPEGNRVEVADFKIISYADAYAEDGTKDEELAVELYAGSAIAYVPEGTAMTVKHLIDGYIYDNGIDAAENSGGTMYESFSGYASGNGFFWNIYVNGKEASLSTEIKAEDSIKMVYEK